MADKFAGKRAVEEKGMLAVDDETVDRDDVGSSPFVEMEGGDTDPGAGARSPGGDMS